MCDVVPQSVGTFAAAPTQDVARLTMGAGMLIESSHGPSLGRGTRWLVWSAAFVAILLCIVVGPYAALRHPLTVDDAYITLRYARNLNAGLGLAWNPDGVPTYGMDSQLWVFVLAPFARLPLAGGIPLQLASWFTGVMALAVTALAVARHGSGPVVRSFPAAFALAALPLLLNARFDYHLGSGMDTMLSFLANALLVLAVLEYLAYPSRARVVLLGVIAAVAVLARPDNLPCALAAPLLACASAAAGRRKSDVVSFLLIFAVLDAADLFGCLRYFGVALPLRRGVEAHGNYAGFTSSENSLAYAFAALLMAVPFVGILGAAARAAAGRRAAVLLLPAAANVAYLLCLRQHMGFQGRFYVPLLPYLIVPALLAFDAALGRNARHAVLRALAGIASAFVVFALSLPLQRLLVDHCRAWTAALPARVPSLEFLGPAPLPSTDWTTTVMSLGRLVADLPAPLVVAAAEVGYLGFAARDTQIIDLVGLNDNEIASHGLSMDRLLARKPDLIVFPPADYTGLRAVIFADPRLPQRYAVLAGAFNDGIALRRDSPYWNDMQAALGAPWRTLYGSLPMENYVVTRVAPAVSRAP